MSDKKQQTKKAKKSTVSAHVDEETKEKAEAIFEELGLDASTAINIYYHQIVINGGLPFLVQVNPQNDSTANEGSLEYVIARDQLIKQHVLPDDKIVEANDDYWKAASQTNGKTV